MNHLLILVRREFWEHRNTFVVLPAVITLFMVLMVAMGYTLVDYVTVHGDVAIEHSDADEWQDRHISLSMEEKLDMMFAEMERMSERQRERKLGSLLKMLSAPLLVTLWFVVFFYLMSCLYEDRRDRSILFWKSLPVSDVTTVLIKLATAVLIVPLVYMVGIVVIHITILLFGTFATFGSDASAWELLWVPANLFFTWFMMVVFLMAQIVWCLPIYGWILLVSSRVKSVPLAWIVGIPIAVVIVEAMFTRGRPVGEFISRHAVPLMLSDERMTLDFLQYRVVSLDGLVGLLVGAAFVGGAIYFRSKADEV